jgi:2'-5' RNA ligase
MAEQALIVTLLLDGGSFTHFDTLRRAHFPPERNLIPAHVTLFHALPSAEERAISAALTARTAGSAPFALRFPGLRFIGRGCIAVVESPELVQLRATLAAQWQPWLSRQDQQGYRPHITLQNKVASEVARTTFNALNSTWQPFSGSGEGLLLWRYLGGPWELLQSFPFAESVIRDP